MAHNALVAMDHWPGCRTTESDLAGQQGTVGLSPLFLAGDGLPRRLAMVCATRLANVAAGLARPGQPVGCHHRRGRPQLDGLFPTFLAVAGCAGGKRATTWRPLWPRVGRTP